MTIEALQQFLAANSPRKLINLAKGSSSLATYFQAQAKEPEPEEQVLDPDEETEPAAADVAEVEERAEMVAGYLRSQSPETWAKIQKEAMAAGLTEAQLDRIDGAPMTDEEAERRAEVEETSKEEILKAAWAEWLDFYLSE